MNTVTLPKTKYLQILDTQEKLRDDLINLRKIVFHLAQDEISLKYAKRLSNIEKRLSFGKGLSFKNKSEIKRFFQSL